MLYYSRSTRGFYDDAVHGDRMPSDALPLAPLPAALGDVATEEEVEQYRAGFEEANALAAARHDDLMAGQGAGKVIAPGADGMPELVDPPVPTGEEAMANLRATRNWRLSLSDGLVARHRDQKDMAVATTLTDRQFASLLTERQRLRDLPAQTKDAWADHLLLLRGE